MMRRTARERRDYLFRKGLEAKEQAIFDRKKKVKEAMRSGSKLPQDMRDYAMEYYRKGTFDDAETEAPTTHVDDEYALLGVEDPRVLITTAQDPSTRLRTFAKEMKLTIPNSQRMNRGGSGMKDLVDACRRNGFTDIVILHEHRGIPDGMIVSHLPHGPTAYFSLFNVVMRADIPDIENMSEAFPHLIFENFTTALGKRVSTILKALFPVPKDESQRVMTFANERDFISFRHHIYQQPGGKEIALKECGPRFEMRLYQIKLGTLDMKDAESEWQLKAYHRKAAETNVL